MAIKYRIELTAAARGDVEKIFAYISEALLAPEAACKLMAEIDMRVFSLREYPERHALISEPMLAQRGYRKTQVENYLIFYRVCGDAVVVMRVLYSGQDYFRLLC